VTVASIRSSVSNIASVPVGALADQNSFASTLRIASTAQSNLTQQMINNDAIAQDANFEWATPVEEQGASDGLILQSATRSRTRWSLRAW